jgi:hypothetical protein
VAHWLVDAQLIGYDTLVRAEDVPARRDVTRVAASCGALGRLADGWMERGCGRRVDG